MAFLGVLHAFWGVLRTPSARRSQEEGVGGAGLWLGAAAPLATAIISLPAAQVPSSGCNEAKEIAPKPPPRNPPAGPVRAVSRVLCPLKHPSLVFSPQGLKTS